MRLFIKQKNNAILLQGKYKSYKSKNKIKLMIFCAKKLQQIIRRKLAKSFIQRLKKSGEFITRKLRQFLFKCRITRKDRMKKVFLKILDESFEIIKLKILIIHTIFIQKNVIGLLTRIKYMIIVEKGRFKRYK